MPAPDIFAPRSNTTQQVCFERFGLSFSNNQAAAGKLIGSIPVGSFITKVAAHVTVPFNAGTTNPVTLGTSQNNANELLQAADVTAGTAGYYENNRGLGMTFTQTPQPPVNGVDVAEGGVGLWVKYVPTGTAPTTGQVIFVVTYVTPTDS